MERERDDERERERRKVQEKNNPENRYVSRIKNIYRSTKNYINRGFSFFFLVWGSLSPVRSNGGWRVCAVKRYQYQRERERVERE